MKYVVSLSLILLLNFTSLSAARGQARPAPQLRRSIEQVDKLTASEYAKDRIGSVTVGIVFGSNLIWTKSYGYADMEKRVPATKGTVYRIASVTKLFTGLVLLQLVERGRVRLSDPVEKYFPEVNKIQGRFPGAPPITIVQLATMTAGLVGEPENAERYNTGPVTDWEEKLILSLPDTRYSYEPGSYHNYSNTSYAILGATLGRAAGEPYVSYVQKQIIEPLGMTDTSFEPHSQIGPLAKGYHFENGKLDTLTPQRQHGNRGKNVPAGSLYSTVGDMTRLVAFELGEGPANVLKRESLDKSFSALVAADSDLNYGDGIGGFSALRLMPSNFVAVGHLGALPGYSAAVIFDRPSRIGIIMLSNLTNGKADYQELAQRMLANLVRNNLGSTK
ncbi:MAG TPA: serine hydrolase domain-containing protein [Pyrinomonadaceae bacterium]|nr:serine hydrolase domain-containing protein [Pyrinomonadaceae bacterium]